MIIVPVREIAIDSPTIRLDQFLKWAGVAATGGQAKELINSGQVIVNGRIEKRRSHALMPGDEVEIKGACFKLTATPSA